MTVESSERSEDVNQPTPQFFDWRNGHHLELNTILNESLSSFGKHSYHGTTVRMIAKQVGVTVPALYYHYENKEAILVALLDAGIEHLTQLATAAVTQADSTPERFLDLVESVALYMTSSGGIARLHAEARLMSPEYWAEYSRKRHLVEEMFVQTIADGCEASLFSVTNVRDTTRAVLGMLQAISTWFRSGGEIPGPELAVRYRDIAAHTVGAAQGVYRHV